MPLGGIGTGFIVLGADGTLDTMSTIFNDFLGRRKAARAAAGWGVGLEAGGGQFMKRSDIPSERLPFLGLSAGGRTWVLSLKQLDGVESVKDIRYWGHYPVADVRYELDAPVEVELRAWVPFFPGDAAGSNTPGAVFEISLHNASREEQAGTIAFSFHGPREAEVGEAGDFDHQVMNGDVSGVSVRTQRESLEYGYTVAAIGNEKARVGGELGTDGSAWSAIARALPEIDSGTGGASVALDFSLGPRESKTVRFVLAWYAPRWQGELDIDRCTRLSVPEVSRLVDWASLPRNTYVHMYHERFKGPSEVACYLAREHEGLLKRVLAWQEVIYAEERLPGWLRDSLINIFHVIPQMTFWDKSADPDYWCKEGIFSANETLLTCPQQTCLSCDLFGQWPIDLFFPELTRSKLRVFKHYQKDHGQVPSAFGPGTELDMRWYDQQTPYDNQVYIQLVDAIWQVTGDDSIPQEFYDSVRKCTKFLMSTDHDDDGLVDLFEVDSLNYPEAKGQYHDGWRMSGPATHVAGIWLATLEVVERMAEKMADSDFARKCRAMHELGTKALEEKLWNEKVGSYLLFNDTRKGHRSDTILSDHMIGECLASLHGLAPVFPAHRARTVLETLWRLNVAMTPVGIRVAVRPDGSSDDESGYTGAGVIPAYSTLVPAMNMIQNGDPERGLEIVYRVWRRMVMDLSMTWAMPGGLTPEGDFLWGHEYWQNTMLWALPLVVLGETMRATAAPGGFAHRIIQAAQS